MDFSQFAQDAGCRPEATEDVVRRCATKFAGETPSPAVVTQWLRTTLRAAAPHLFRAPETLWDKLGMDQATFDAMPPAWRLGQAMAEQARVTTPHPRRPVSRNLTAAELDSIQHLPFHERHEAGRKLQQTPLPQQSQG
jgi:hypothetical protein